MIMIISPCSYIIVAIIIIVYLLNIALFSFTEHSLDHNIIRIYNVNTMQFIKFINFGSKLYT
jgi:hypothetical protein